MSHRDELSAALARIEVLREEIRAAELGDGKVADLRNRVEALERTLAELRSPPPDCSSPAARRKPHASSAHVPSARPLLFRIALTIVVGAAAFLPLMVFVPSGRYYGDKGVALMQWALGCVLLPAGTAVLSLPSKWRWLGGVVVALGVLVYWTAWSWARRLGVVTFIPFE